VKVVNRHHHRGQWPAHTFYVGRPDRIAREEIARGALDATLFGNPFTVKEHGDKALVLYKRHLWNAAKDSRGILLALTCLPPDAILVCSCAPRPCHGEVIVALWTWLFRKRRRFAALDRRCRWPEKS